MEVLSSLRNPRIALARKLRRRQIRDKERAFIIEGPAAVADAIAAGCRVIDLFATEPVAELQSLGVTVTPVTEPVLRAVSGTDHPSGVVAVVEMPAFSLEELGPEASLVLVLAEVRDPGNAGTLTRSARAAGADAVVFSEGSVDPFSPKTVRASASTIATTPVARDIPLRGVVSLLRERGFEIVGTSATAPVLLYEHDLSGPLAVVVGNEAWGLPTPDLVDTEVAIPMPGPVESLNVAVAGSLVLFEVVRQRRQGPS